MAESKRILVGVVGAPHGVRGEVRLKSFTGVPQAIADYGIVTSHDGRRALTFAAARPLKDDMLVVRFEGVADRDAAAALTNLQLFVERSRLPAAEEDEYYQTDLVGLRADSEAGETIGSVIAVQNFGAGDLLEIAPGQGGETLLVPFSKAFVPVVELGAGRLVVADAAFAGEDEPPEDGA